MKGLETGKDKVKKICEVLRKETLEPAQHEAQGIIEQAQARAEELIQDARRSIEKMQIEAQTEIERQKKIFESAIAQGCKQALESLKQEIERKLFNQELFQLISKKTQEVDVLAELISAVVKALEKEGIDGDLSAYIPAAVPARAVNALLLKTTIDRLKEKSVLIGTAAGGVEIKLHKENITLDISAQSLKEIVAAYVRKDFRELLFGKE